jgi:PilZ domain
MALPLKDALARIFRPPAAPLPQAASRERREDRRMPMRQTVLVEWQDLEKGDQAFAGRLENRSRKGFGIRGPRLLPRGKTILITPEQESPVKGVVRHCASGEGGFYLGVELIRNDRRRSDREPMYCSAQITCTRAGRRADLAVIIRDASEGGLQLESPEPVKVEQLIEISHLGSYREGVVTHCNEVDDGYRIGVQFVGPAWREGDRRVS